MPPVTSICQPDLGRIEAAYQKSLTALLAERNADGYWTGELSSSALSTATAISALALVQKQTGLRSHDQLIANGLAWLAKHQNADGGWGDTVKSFSNISTTMLCRAAFHLAGGGSRFALVTRQADAWMDERHESGGAVLVGRRGHLHGAAPVRERVTRPRRPQRGDHLLGGRRPVGEASPEHGELPPHVAGGAQDGDGHS